MVDSAISSYQFRADLIPSVPEACHIPRPGALRGDHWQSHVNNSQVPGSWHPQGTPSYWWMKVDWGMLLPFVSGPSEVPIGLTTVAHSGGQLTHSFPPSLFHSFSLIHDSYSLGSLPK